MKRRISFIGLSLILLSLFAIYPVWAGLTSVNLSVSDQGLAFSLMRQTASSFFSVSVRDIQSYQPAQLLPVLFIAAETRQDPDTVIRRKKGNGWGRTAKDMGLPANTHGKYMSKKHKNRYSSVFVMDDPDFADVSTIRFISEYYGTDPSIITYWNNRGLSWNDILIGINLASRLNRKPGEFFQLRASGRDWQFIATRYHVSYKSLSQPVPPRHKMTLRKNSPQPNQNRNFTPPGQQKKKGKHK